MTPKRDFLRVAVEEWGTWVRVFKRDDGKLYVTGPMADILQILSDKLNFDYELVQPSDHVWGVPLANGSWTGMLGMLQREEVEFALGPFGVTASRDTVCDFSVPVKTENSGILVVRPTLESDMAGFLKPFQLWVWILIVASVLATTAAFAFTAWGEGKIFHIAHRNPLSTSILWVLKALTQEATEWLPSTDGSRVIIVTWLLASFVFMSSYSGILTAMLTVPKVNIPIDSMLDLVSQTKLPWSLESGSWLLQYFREAPDDVRRRLYNGHTIEVPDCWAAKEPIAKGEFAVICDHTTMKKAMSWDFSLTGACHLYMSKEVVTNFNLAMAFKTNSKYKPHGDYWITKLKESGILDLWLEQQFVNTSYCLRPPSADRDSQEIKPLDLKSLVGCMLLLLAGLVVAFVGYIFEIIYWWMTTDEQERSEMISSIRSSFSCCS